MGFNQKLASGPIGPMPCFQPGGEGTSKLCFYEPSNPGTLEPWNPSFIYSPRTLGPSYPGTLLLFIPLEPWNPRTLEPFFYLFPLNPGTLGPWNPLFCPMSRADPFWFSLLEYIKWCTYNLNSPNIGARFVPG